MERGDGMNRLLERFVDQQKRDYIWRKGAMLEESSTNLSIESDQAKTQLCRTTMVKIIDRRVPIGDHAVNASRTVDGGVVTENAQRV